MILFKRIGGVNISRKIVTGLAVTFILLAEILFCGRRADAAFWDIKKAPVDLRLLETSDLHGYMLNYNYLARNYTQTYGLSLTAALIAKERKEANNSMLFDDGDLLEGNEMASYIASRPLRKGEIHPIIKVLNALKYDAATVGNHDFHYGLDFLNQAIRGAKFPYVNANIYYKDKTKYDAEEENFFKPYVILNKKVKDRDGHSQKIKVGVIGFVTPYVTAWERPVLQGRITAKDMMQTAARFIPEMKEQGADIIIALAHCGVDPLARQSFSTNDAVYLLSQVKGIDVILFGHQHKVFPSEEFAGVSGVNIASGTINGVPAVMPGKWGSHLGVVDLTLEKKDGKWETMRVKSEAKPVFMQVNADKKAIVKSDPVIWRIMGELHRNILDSKFTLFSKD